MKLTPLCIRLIARIARSRSVNVRLDDGDSSSSSSPPPADFAIFRVSCSLSPPVAVAIATTTPHRELPSSRCAYALPLVVAQCTRFDHVDSSRAARLSPADFLRPLPEMRSRAQLRTLISIPRVLINTRAVLITRLCRDTPRVGSPFRNGMSDHFGARASCAGIEFSIETVVEESSPFLFLNYK